jgi:alkanesulfonate monooxygenase SsuD/methylene tetrahydromethanopterin reductase-like flavin-dependent oxidoreductase (luciferase family)
MSHDLRVGINLRGYYETTGGLEITKRARLAEKLGFDDLWFGDHTVFRRPMGDIQVMTAMAAAVTERIQICLGVIQVGLRHPVTLAKWLGALSHEVPGRVLAGIGVGGAYRDEWTALGIEASQRGKRFDEVMSVLPELLANKTVSHHGANFDFEVGPLFSSPPPPLPFWIGARVDASLPRMENVDGWFAMNRLPEEFATERKTLADARPPHRPLETGIAIVASVLGTDAEAKARCAEYFRSLYGLPPGRGERRSVGGVAALRDLLAQYREGGADRVALMIIDEPESALPIVARALL